MGFNEEYDAEYAVHDLEMKNRDLRAELDKRTQERDTTADALDVAMADLKEAQAEIERQCRMVYRSSRPILTDAPEAFERETYLGEADV